MCQIDDEELSGLKARPEKERERGARSDRVANWLCNVRKGLFLAPRTR